MGDHRVLRPLSQQHVQAETVFGRQRLGCRGGDLSGQGAACAVRLLGDVLIQLHLAEPEQQDQHQQHGGQYHQRQGAGQCQGAAAQVGVAA